MTHDELLESLEYPWVDMLLVLPRAEKYKNALRAVVELHKPVDCEALDGSQGTMCINCRDGFYPCLTIQAIEWNLNEL